MARLFWPLILVSTLAEAIAAGCVAAAAFSDPLARRVYTYSPSATTELFGRTVSLSWHADRGLLIAAALFAAAGVGGFGAAARWRRSG